MIFDEMPEIAKRKEAIKECKRVIEMQQKKIEALEKEIEDIQNMKRCPYCGNEDISERAVFCCICGKKLKDNKPAEPAQPTCWSCGSVIKKDALFCIHCGVSLKKKEEAPAAVTDDTVVLELPPMESELPELKPSLTFDTMPVLDEEPAPVPEMDIKPAFELTLDPEVTEIPEMTVEETAEAAPETEEVPVAPEVVEEAPEVVEEVVEEEAPQVEPGFKICQNCQAKINESFAFCTNCGTKFPQ